MIRADIEVLHSIKGRLRIRFAEGFKSISQAYDSIIGQGISEFTYNPRIKTAVIEFENIKKERVLAKVAAYYAGDGHKNYVHVRDACKENCGLSSTEKASFLAVTCDALVRLFAPKSSLVNVTAICAVASTVASIAERGFKDYSKKEALDKDLKSVISLLGILSGGKSDFATAKLWLGTFGQKLYWNDECDTLLKVEECYIPDSDDTEFEVTDVTHSENTVVKQLVLELFDRYLTSKVTKKD